MATRSSNSSMPIASCGSEIASSFPPGPRGARHIRSLRVYSAEYCLHSSKNGSISVDLSNTASAPHSIDFRRMSGVA